MPPKGPHHEKHRAEDEQLLKLEFRTFVAGIIRLPCQIVRTGGKRIYRLLAWNRWQETFFRIAEHVRRPSRC